MNFVYRDEKYETIGYIIAIIIIVTIVGFGVYRTYIKFSNEMSISTSPESISLEGHEFWKSGYYLLHKPNCPCKGKVNE